MTELFCWKWETSYSHSFYWLPSKCKQNFSSAKKIAAHKFGLDPGTSLSLHKHKYKHTHSELIWCCILKAHCVQRNTSLEYLSRTHAFYSGVRSADQLWVINPLIGHVQLLWRCDWLRHRDLLMVCNVCPAVLGSSGEFRNGCAPRVCTVPPPTPC